MHQTDSSESQLAAALQEVEDLRSRLHASELQISSLLEMFEDQQRKLADHQASLARLERMVMDLVTGRVWRTLRAMGKVVKVVLPGPMPQRALETSSAGKDKPSLIARRNTYLVCDEPNGSGPPRSGKINVRGWTVAEGGVDTVQVEIPGLPLLETKPCIPRPDVQKSLPNLDKTGRSGFATQFDSLSLPNGRHPLMLRALVKGLVVRETQTFVDIDHEKGFASEYLRWIHEFERPDMQRIGLKLSALALKPLISILMPVFNTKPDELASALDSVLNQSYENWELRIADDCSTKPEVRELLTRYAARDSRIKVIYRSENGGISRASNTAWEAAQGDFITLLDHDDTLAQHALAFLVEAINQNPYADLIYSDEDKIDEHGERFDPFFKPDWCPDLFLSENYICHLLALRRDLADKVKGFRPEFDGSQDYDLVLRASEEARRIHHIPKVLYHWRAGAASTASGMENKSYAIDAARRALQEHCARKLPGAVVDASPIQGRWRIRYPIPECSRVSIIIASGGKVDILRTNLDSLFGKTAYKDYEVVIADNSKAAQIEKLAQDYQANYPNLRYFDWRNKPFNFSAINNAAAKTCDSPLLLFLNDDTSVIDPGWLQAMVELAARQDVGAVGAKLLYPNGIIQHAGVVMGVFDNCGHAFKGLDGAVGHYFDMSDVIRNVSAVTGACLMSRSQVFWQASGFDEADFAVAFNDIDLCLKIGSYGYQVLYTPHAVLYHHESLSKTSKDLIPHPDEVAAMRFKWGKIIENDPCYNPNLSRTDEDFSLRTRT